MAWQRRYERVPFFCPIEMTVLPGGQTVSATSFDITIAGVGLTASVFLERGQPVRLLFHLGNGSHEPVDDDILGRVVYVRSDENGNRMGVEFLELVNESTHPALAQRLANL